MAYNQNIVLGVVKARLNRLPDDKTLDAYLITRIEAAHMELEKNGIFLEGDIEDNVLLADYAVWAYQNRDKSGGMPSWLKLKRRERWLSGKGRA